MIRTISTFALSQAHDMVVPDRKSVLGVRLLAPNLFTDKLFGAKSDHDMVGNDACEGHTSRIEERIFDLLALSCFEVCFVCLQCRHTKSRITPRPKG